MPSTVPSTVPSSSPYAAFTTTISSAFPLPGALGFYVQVRRDLAYGADLPANQIKAINDLPVGVTGDAEQVMDIYYPSTPSVPLKTILFVHKGGWIKELDPNSTNGRMLGGSKTSDNEGCTGNSADYTRDTCQCPVAVFASKGYAVACMNYHLIVPVLGGGGGTPLGTVPRPIIDVKTAIRYLKKNYGALGIDRNKIAVWGVASGGHMAAMAGTTAPSPGFTYPANFEGTIHTEDPTITSSVRAVVDYSGFTDLSLPDNATVIRSISYYLPLPTFGALPIVPAVPTSTSTAAQVTAYNTALAVRAAEVSRRDNQKNLVFSRYSPRIYVNSNTAPFFIIHGEGDYVVPQTSSTTLLFALQTYGITTTGLGQPMFTCGQAALFTVGNVQPVECTGRATPLPAIVANPNKLFPVLSGNPYYYTGAMFDQVNTFLLSVMN